VQIPTSRNQRIHNTIGWRHRLAQFQGSPNTLQLYETHVKNHIKPLIGDVKIGP